MGRFNSSDAPSVLCKTSCLMASSCSSLRLASLMRRYAEESGAVMEVG